MANESKFDKKEIYRVKQAQDDKIDQHIDPVEERISWASYGFDKKYLVDNGKGKKKEFDDAIDKARKQAMYYTRSEYEWYTKFHRFGGGFTPSNIFGPTREYVFFVKPDLHLYDVADSFHLNGDKVQEGQPNPELADIAFFKDMYDDYPDVLNQLQSSHNGPYNTGPFMNLLSSAAQSEVDMGSISVTDVDGPLTVYGDSIIYSGNSLTEEYNKDFSLDFKDTKYLEVYRLFKTWDLYRNYKQMGAVTPTKQDYIIHKRLHDQCCAYKIVVGEDGESIIYWAKLWGVYNTNVPRDTFSSMPKDGTLNFTVNFNATFTRDLDPFSLFEFNKLTESIPRNESHIAIHNNFKDDADLDSHVNYDWVGCPYVVSSRDELEGRNIYKLKWRKA